jgi:hypothetical protein
MSAKQTEARILNLDPTTLDDDDLDVWIGQAKQRIKALADNGALQALQAARRDQRQALRSKLNELMAEARTRGLRN